MSATWTTTALKSAIARRGEYMRLSPKVAEALLYQEQSYGRTEVNVPKPEARSKLDTLLDQLMPSDIPNPLTAEYKGIARLRRAVEQRTRERNAAMVNEKPSLQEKQPAQPPRVQQEKAPPAEKEIAAFFDNSHKVDPAVAAQEAAFAKANPTPGTYDRKALPFAAKKKDRSL